jgi:hypothetical protein
MTAAAGSPLAPPGRAHLRPVPAGSDLKEERVPMPRPSAAPDPRLLELAKRVQATFRHHGLSLADKDTATAYLASIDALRPILDGALATGVLTDDQHRKITGMFAFAAGAPTAL